MSQLNVNDGSWGGVHMLSGGSGGVQGVRRAVSECSGTRTTIPCSRCLGGHLGWLETPWGLWVNLCMCEGQMDDSDWLWVESQINSTKVCPYCESDPFLHSLTMALYQYHFPPTHTHTQKCTCPNTPTYTVCLSMIASFAPVSKSVLFLFVSLSMGWISSSD